MEQAFAAAIETRQPRRLEVTAHCKDRAPFDVDVVLSPIVEYDNRLTGVVCSLRDITRRKQMEAQLRRTLEREMELKSRYVSMAAHDLRSPLAIIQSAADMIQHYSDKLTDEQKQAKLNNIHASIEVMVETLDDILTIGKIESGKFSFNPTPIDVVAFCQQIAAEVHQATGATQHIDFSSQGACGTAYVDARLLRHILGNLLSNACKYSSEESAVVLVAECDHDQIAFHIQDDGIGIPEADQKRLFEAFHRASNAKHIPGTGLGLAIVKQSVELHGGTIVFESEEDIGTTVTVVIPHTPSDETHGKNPDSSHLSPQS